MTEEQKLIKHTEDLINAFNDTYKDYRNSLVADKIQAYTALKIMEF